MKKKTEFEIPSGLKYTKLHEWLKIESNVLTFGITDFAQYQMGDINSIVDFPKVGTILEPLLKSEQELTVEREGKTSTAYLPGKTLATIDCSKGIFYAYSPVKGRVLEVNEVLSDFGAGETVNNDPYGEGWFAKIEILDSAQLENLLDDKDYKKFIRGE